MSKKTEVTPRGVEILHDSFLNKGTAFTAEERDKLGLRGLLPPHIGDQDTQVRRVMEQFDNKPNDLEKFIFMIALQDRNENLFYRVVLDHVEKMMRPRSARRVRSTVTFSAAREGSMYRPRIAVAWPTSSRTGRTRTCA